VCGGFAGAHGISDVDLPDTFLSSGIHFGPVFQGFHAVFISQWWDVKDTVLLFGPFATAGVKPSVLFGHDG
jgi:hypothetical protein